MAQKHNAEYTEKPMTRDGRIQGPSRRYRRLRHPTFEASVWADKNPLLQRGEIGYEVDTHKVKVGDGVTYWNDLPYTYDEVGQPTSTADYQMGNAQGGWTTMSEAQQKAINSGATTTNIGQIATNTTNISNHVSNTNNPHSVTAAQIGALPNTTKYGAALSLTINSTNYVVTAQLKDQDGNNLGTAQTIDLPLESVVVSGAYDSVTKEVVLTLQDGSKIRFSVADLVSGLQTEITALNMLSADLVDDTSTTHKFVTTTEKSTWNGKQDAISDLATIRSGAAAGATAVQPSDLATVATTGSYNDLSNKPTLGTMAAENASDYTKTSGLATVATSGNYNDLTNKPTLGTAAAANTTDFATAAQGALADTAVQPGDLATVATTGDYDDLTNKPTIPTVNNSTITITQGGVTKGSFTLNQASGDTIDLDAGGGSGLPSQTGNAGKFLTTDGTDASWSDKPLVNTATGTNAIGVGNTGTVLGNNSTVFGTLSKTYAAGNNSVAVGFMCSGYASYSVAIGNKADASAQGAIQISARSTNAANSDANTFKVANANGNFEIMSANGTIPEARLADTTSAIAGQVLTLDSNLDATWATPTASVAWGGITGTLADQTDLNNALKALVPTGTVFVFAGVTLPTGFLLCDGSAVSRTTYADLFAAIGTTYGAGDGSTTFNVPSIVNRVPMYRVYSTPDALGTTNAGKLPNITGSLNFQSGSGSSAMSPLRSASGAFTASDSVTKIAAVVTSGSYTAYGKTALDASRSSSVYTDITTVQPRSVQMYYIIKY